MSKIFVAIKCVLRSAWDLPTQGDKNALKQPHTFVELRLCKIYQFTEDSSFKSFSEPTGNQGVNIKIQNVHG